MGGSAAGGTGYYGQDRGLMPRMKLIYKTLGRTGKIDVGKDLTGTASYFGSIDNRLIEADFTPEQCRDLTVRKEILWSSETATDQEVNAKDIDFIRSLKSDDPGVGYNRWPKFRPQSERT